MHRYLILLIIFSLSSETNASELSSLEVYIKNDPEKAFEKDLSTGTLHFLSTMGISTEIPGVGWIAKNICFNKIDSKIIDDTGDVISGATLEEAFYYKVGARKYAEKYNNLLKRHLVRTGKSHCEIEENWKTAFHELNSYIWGSPTRHGSGLGGPLNPSENFSISLVDLNLTEEMTNKACEIYLKNGISREIGFDLDEHKKYDGIWRRTEIASFTCVNGVRSKLKLKDNQ